MKKQKRGLAVTVAMLVLLSMTAMASTGRYDQQIQQTVTHKLHDAKQLQGVNSSVEDGIVTLTGTVGLYQDKPCPMPSSSRNWQRSWPMTASDTTTTHLTILRSA